MYRHNRRLANLRETRTAYLDDIIIFSDNLTEHVKKVLARLSSAGLQVEIKKCEFGVTLTKFLRFILTTERVEVDPEKIAVILRWENA